MPFATSILVRWVLCFALRAAPPDAPCALADIGPAPDVVLKGTDGKTVALSDLRGKAVVVSFVYTTCSGSCPATTLHLTQVQKALTNAGLWGSRVQFVSISLDPARDTPEVLAAYSRNFGADSPSWHFLTGPPDRVAKVIAGWDMWVKTGANGQLDHPSRIFLVDPRGRQREIYNLESLTPKIVVQDVQAVLDESGKPDVEKPH